MQQYKRNNNKTLNCRQVNTIAPKTIIKPIIKTTAKKQELPKTRVINPIKPQIINPIKPPVNNQMNFQQLVENSLFIRRLINNQNGMNILINELKNNINSLSNKISSEKDYITTKKITTNDIFIKNNNEYINIKDYIKENKLTDNITVKSINITNDAIFNGNIIIKQNNKSIEINANKSYISSENGFVKNVDEDNNTSIVNINYLKKYINNKNEIYYAYLFTKSDIYPLNYDNDDYILHYTPNSQSKYTLKQIQLVNNVKVIKECKNIKEGTICITYDTIIKMFVYVNTNDILDWVEFKNNSIIDNLTINKSFSLNNKQINNILTGENNNDSIPTIGYLESNYIKNDKEIKLDKLNLPVKIPENKKYKNTDNITINYITATNIDERNQSIPTVEYVNSNYVKKGDIQLLDYVKKENIPIIITRNDTITESSDKNVYSSKKIDNLFNNTVQKISNLKITFNIKWKDSSEKESEYSISSVSGTIITLHKVNSLIYEENLLNIPSLEINFDNIKDSNNNIISYDSIVDIYLKEISILSSDDHVVATYYITKNKPTTLLIKDNDTNNYKTEFISIVDNGHLIFNNKTKLYHKTIYINMDNIYVCSRPSD